jgi:hypothetical protein
MRAVWCGLLYALAAFAFGFLLGPIREFWLAPAMGRFPATLVEIPLMLGFCWWLAGRGVWTLPQGAPRLLMGGVALALLLAAEFFLGLLLRGWGLAAWLRHFREADGMLTAAAYLAFALLPWIRGRV